MAASIFRKQSLKYQNLAITPISTRFHVFLLTEKWDRILVYSFYVLFKIFYCLSYQKRQCLVKSHATRNKSLKYCGSMNSISILFDVLTFLTIAFDVILQEILNICIITMAMSLATKKFNLTGTTFGLKFIRFFFNLSPIYKGNRKVCITILAVPLTTKKSNPTSTKFDLKLIRSLFQIFHLLSN